MSGNEFYSKVSQLDLKDLIEFIDHNQTELTVKVLNQFVKTSVLQIKNDRQFSIFRFNDFEFSNEPVICYFRRRDDLYFFKSYLNNGKVDYLIDLPEAIYQLQRRNDFRISVPIGTSHICKINYARGLEKNVKAELRDLSLGGCQLSVAAHEIELMAGDKLDISLKIDRFDFTRLDLEVRHIKQIKEQDCLLIGASFVNLDGENLTEMRGLLMFLDRKSRGRKD